MYTQNNYTAASKRIRNQKPCDVEWTTNGQYTFNIEIEVEETPKLKLAEGCIFVLFVFHFLSLIPHLQDWLVEQFCQDRAPEDEEPNDT